MWKYNSIEVTDISQVPLGAVGFIYVILNSSTGEYYIGKKQLYSTRTLPPLKGTRRKRKVIKESDWKTYQSSSKKVKEWISPKKSIIVWCYSKKELTYEETRALMCYRTMEDELSLNENILGKFFKFEFGRNV